MLMNHIRTWTDDAVEAVDYLCADYRDFAFPPHLHDTYAIGVIERGTQSFRSGRHTPVLMTEGTVCVINPGMVHEGRGGSADGWRYRMFYPSAALVARALGMTGDQAPSFDGHVIDDRALYRCFEILHQASQHTEDLLERESQILLFLHDLFERHARTRSAIGQARQPRTVSIVKQMLHDSCGDAISIGDLAMETGVSETQVIRSFTASVGLAPHAYLIALRIERAKVLIRRGHPLADVAFMAGFSDQSHLNRHFRRITSLTPGQFARALH